MGLVAQQSPSADQPKMASIEGSVVKDQGGEPVKKANVQVINEDRESSNYSATTDADGHFKVESVEPGRYRIFVERTGFIEIDQHRHRSDGTEVSLQAGQNFKDMVLRVLPAAVITGRVVDEDGEPMPNVEVSLLAYSYTSCHRRLDTQRSERTNDLGEYRIGGLFSGRYFVAASPAPDYTSTIVKEEPELTGKPQTSYVTTYYPGVTDRGQAAPIELHPGEEVPISFSLSPIPTFRVRGTVANLAAAGHGSDPKAMVMLRPKSFDMVFNAAEVDKDGNFEIRGVAPGSYTAWLMTANGETTGTPQPVEVTNSNIDNLRLVPVPGGHVRGQLRVEGNHNIDLSAFTVFLRALDSEAYKGAIGSYEGKVKRDGSFSINNPPPGNYEVALSALSNDYASYFVKSVGMGGHEMPDAVLRVTGGVVGIEVTASANSAQVDGTVSDKDNQPARNATVVAVPTSSGKKESDQYGFVLADQNGHFHMRGLRPGDYRILAWEDVESGAWCDPDFVQAYESFGQPVHLAEGRQQSVSVKQIPAAKQP
jgi:protocatechuate 3,4-dioxygenase beta subunit